MFGQRQGIIVYLHSLKHIKSMRRFGNIHYVSKRLKYMVIYNDMDNVESLIGKIKSLPYVKQVEPSYKPYLKLEYENSNPDKAKEYDYKIGL
ncbi:YlbG family protein [Bacillus sp. PS06]|uniref:YlbG family protein n=1 Tax=Bacillus sp. PS06 TaxID=2764176 RepID=UPI001780A398|nr:YlbG family protein [Bacillus sp. PS06]MBD8068413.1 YlbG family protein [Bacillus sp. PS06]